MKIINQGEIANVANQRLSQPLYKARTMRFPTTAEVQQTYVNIQDILKDDEIPLVDRLFPIDSTLATKIEMNVIRSDDKDNVGMTFPTTPEADIRTFSRESKMDMATMLWSPAQFKESKRWGEIEMLELGRLAEDVAESQFGGEIFDYMVLAEKRMEKRRRWLCWEVLRNGRLVIDNSTPDNPNRIKYDIDYRVTDHTLSMPVKIDQKDGSGNSLLDPTEWIRSMNKSAKWTGNRVAEIIVNSNFVEYLTDNTFIQQMIDYERGVSAVAAVKPPRSFYASQALATFQRIVGAGVKVTFVDDTYYDPKTNKYKYYLEDGEAIILFGSSAPLGNFMYTGHIQGISPTGEPVISTGKYMFTHDNTRTVKPHFELIAGFNGLPRLTGYDPVDLGYHRFKYVKFAEHDVQDPPLPERPDIGKAIV